MEFFLESSGFPYANPSNLINGNPLYFIATEYILGSYIPAFIPYLVPYQYIAKLINY